MIVLERYDQLDLDDYRRVVCEREPVELSTTVQEHVAQRRRAMEEHLAGGGPAYGVTTGLGYLAARSIAADDQLDLQRSILVGRAAAVGEPLPEKAVRGAMLLRLTGFLSGHPGVTPALCRFIAERLNDGWYPVVPASRPGTAGETIPLCHLFQTFIGEGEVLVQGRRVAAATALDQVGAAPYELQLKEGLALVNGAPLAPALAAALATRAESLLEQATVLGALAAALVGAPVRPYSSRIGRLKGDPGQQHVHARLAELSAVAGPEQGPQAPVSLRVLPQVHGAARDQLDHLLAQLERELRAVTDSPLYLEAEGDEPEGFYSSGNFHSQALSLALDALAIAFTQVAALAEKRLHRLLDSRFSGLPEQLSSDPERGHCGLVALHKAVVGLVGREPAAGGAGVGARRRHLLRPGGLPGLHGARCRQARAAAGQPRAGARLRACGVAPGSRAQLPHALTGAIRRYRHGCERHRGRRLRSLAGPRRGAGARADSLRRVDGVPVR